jgi:glycosyltransferase involved in cell wall biosynthesis
LLEAHAVGIPSVASRARGNREAVTTKTGRLCEISDADDYASALAELIDDPELRRRVGRLARQRAEEHFDTAVNSRRIVAMYEELLGISRTTQPLPLAA